MSNQYDVLVTQFENAVAPLPVTNALLLLFRKTKFHESVNVRKV